MMSNLTPVMIWAATYFLHSSLLLGGVWCWFRWREPSSHAFRETVWKLAAAGGFVTASLQLGLGIESPINYAARTAWVVPPAVIAPEIEVAQHSKLPVEHSVAPEEHFAFTEARPEFDQAPAHLLDYQPEADIVVTSPVVVSDVPTTAPLNVTPVAETPRGETVPTTATVPNWNVSFSELLVAVFAAIGGALVALSGWGLCRLLSEHFEFRQRLARCRSVASGQAREILDQLLEQTGIRRPVTLLICEDGLEPGACGWWRWQIVLPSRAAEELAPQELRALLAHELAHLVRGDQWWLLLGRLLVVCFGWQPLNRIALREWQRASEYLCDGWAVQRDVERLSLARCLTTVAEWRLVGMATIAGLGSANVSNLTQRVERLIDDAPLLDPWQRYGRQQLVSAVGSVVAIVMVAYAPAATWASPTRVGAEQHVDQQNDRLGSDVSATGASAPPAEIDYLHRTELAAANQPVPFQVQLLPTEADASTQQTHSQLIIGIELIRVVQQHVSVDMRELNAELQALEAVISEMPVTRRRPQWEMQLQRFRQRVANMERLHEALLMTM